MTSTDDLVRQIHDRDAITAVIHRRARATDTRDLELSLSCYHPGATEDHEGFDGPVDDYLRTASPAFAPDSPVEVCSHLIGNVEIDLDDDRAHSQSYFICCLTNRDDGAGGGRTDYINAGRYIDDWERRDGVWAMTRRVCAYDWSRSDPATQRWFER